MTWPKVAFTDVCDIQGGTQPPKSQFIDHPKDGYIRLLQIQDFKREDKAVYVPQKSSLKTCIEDDILIGRYGASVGKILSGKAGAYNVAIAKTLPNLDKIIKPFLGHLLKSPSFQNFILNVGSRAAQAGFNKDDLSRHSFILPPIEAQRRIAAILDKADAVQKKRQQSLDMLDDFLRVTFLDIVGPNAPDYEEWEEIRIEELALPEKGSMRTGPFGSALKHSEFVDQGIAVLGIDNAVQNRFAWKERRFITAEKYRELKRYTVQPKDVIITIMGTTGRSAVVPDNIPTAITTKHLATISVDQTRATPEFVCHAIQLHPHALRQIRQANKGAVMPGLNLGIVKSLTVRRPPINIQQQYTEMVQHIENLRTNLLNEQKESSDLFASLSQRAFKGEL